MIRQRYRYRYRSVCTWDQGDYLGGLLARKFRNKTPDDDLHRKPGFDGPTLTAMSPQRGKTSDNNLLLTMADQAPSRAVLPAVSPEVDLVESIKSTSGDAAGRTVLLSEKKAMVDSTVLSCY